MDLENLTIQDLVKMEGFTERCQVARRYPLAMMMVTASRDRSLAEIVDKLPSILVSDEEKFIARLAGLAAESEQNAPVKKAEEKPAAESPSPYEGLSAKELYCICKERGLTVAEKQPVETYREALLLDDMAREAHEAKEAAEAQKAAEPGEKADAPDITAVPVPEADEEAEEFDDWDDAEPAAEPAKEQEAAGDDDDDDDDWDI